MNFSRDNYEKLLRILEGIQKKSIKWGAMPKKAVGCKKRGNGKFSMDKLSKNLIYRKI